MVILHLKKKKKKEKRFELYEIKMILSAQQKKIVDREFILGELSMPQKKKKRKNEIKI